MNPQQQLAMLLQPALIRLIDQLRQQLTGAQWNWGYETLEFWPEQVSSEERQQYDDLMQALDVASDEDAETIQDVLMTLPQPVPLYRLDIEQAGEQTAINMWELCYQICLYNYQPDWSSMHVEAPNLSQYKLDKSLFDADFDIKWEVLDAKARQVVSRMMQQFQGE